MPTTYADLVSNGGRVDDVLADIVHLLLADRSALRGRMTFVPMPDGGGATTQVPQAQPVFSMEAATSESDGSNVSSTPLPTANFPLTVSRYLAKRTATGLFDLTAGTAAAINVEFLVNSLADTLDYTLTDLLVALFPNISGSVGTTGTPLTFDDIMDGQDQLNTDDNEGRVSAVLHSKQINEVRNSLRGESSNIIMNMPETALAGFAQPGFGYRFSHGSVDFFQSNKVTVVGPDYVGCMFAEGAFAYTLGPIARFSQIMHNQQDIVLATPELYIERSRDADNDLTAFIVNSWPAASEAEDARAVRVLSAT